MSSRYQVTNEQIYEKYIAEVGSQQSVSTRATDKNVLRVLSNFTKKPYTDISKDDIVKLINALSHGTLLTSRGKPYGEYSIVIFKSQLMKFFKWLYNWQSGQALPEQISFFKLNIKRAYRKKTIADILTEDEVQKLIDTAKTPRNKAIISVLYDSGIRAGENVSLNIGDVITQNDIVKLNVKGTKNNYSQRTVPLGFSIKYLKEYLSVHPFKDSRDAPLWLNYMNLDTPERFAKSSIKYLVIGLAKKAGMKKITPHILRHSRATELAKKGITEAQMRIFFGWSPTSTTPSKYIHLCGADVENALHKVEPNVKYVPESELQERESEIEQRIEKRIIEKLMNNFDGDIQSDRTFQELLHSMHERA